MVDIFVKTTSIKTPCEMYRCKGMNYIEIGVERGPGNLTQRFCRDCFVQVIKKAPKDILVEALGEIDTDEINAKISTLESIIATLDMALAAKTEEVEKLLEAATKPVEPEEPSCGICEKQFSKKSEEPCKSCKVTKTNTSVTLTKFKAREKKQEV